MRVDYMINLFTPGFYSFDLQYLQAKSRMIKSNSFSFVERFVAQTAILYTYTKLPFERWMSFLKGSFFV